MLKKSNYVSITEYKTSGEYRITIYGKQQTIRELALSEVYANKESEYARSILDILARDFTQYDTQEYPLTTVRKYKRITTVRKYKRKDPITTKKTWPVYSVMFGMPGYMPDDVCYFTNKRAALGYMADEAKDLRSEDWTVSGSAEYGYTCQAPWHDIDYFSLDWNVEHFSSKAERDQFIAQNSEF